MSERTTVRDPVDGQTTQHAHGVWPLTCQITADTSTARSVKSAMMKLNQRDRKHISSVLQSKSTQSCALIGGTGVGRSISMTTVTFLKQKPLATDKPVHVQDGATSCPDAADDHRGRKDALSMLRHQRHVNVEFLKILQNKTTHRKLFNLLCPPKSNNKHGFLSRTLHCHDSSSWRRPENKRRRSRGFTDLTNMINTNESFPPDVYVFMCR